MTLLADLVLIAHLLFIVFVIFGGLIVLKWHRAIWLHIPCAIWGALIEFFGCICPLTYLENYFRQAGNADSYEGGFIQHYLVPVIYPAGLTTGIQILLGVIVVAINLVIYYFIWRYWYDKHTN
jgi:hypothetical protein